MILADTGALYALADRRDAWHERMRKFWEENPEPWLVPSSVVTEAAFLYGRRLGPEAEADFVASLAAGDFAVETLESADYARAADLIRAYGDLPLGFVDASIVALAERLDVGTLVTTDRRHFALVRPAHVPRLRLVP
ncbi:MAG: PIN domain-containing protein [Gemmatimonadota bacterium]